MGTPGGVPAFVQQEEVWVVGEKGRAQHTILWALQQQRRGIYPRSHGSARPAAMNHTQAAANQEISRSTWTQEDARHFLSRSGKLPRQSCGLFYWRGKAVCSRALGVVPGAQGTHFSAVVASTSTVLMCCRYTPCAWRVWYCRVHAHVCSRRNKHCGGTQWRVRSICLQLCLHIMQGLHTFCCRSPICDPCRWPMSFAAAGGLLSSQQQRQCRCAAASAASTLVFVDDGGNYALLACCKQYSQQPEWTPGDGGQPNPWRLICEMIASSAPS